jgi:hypothetical protein
VSGGAYRPVGSVVPIVRSQVIGPVTRMARCSDGRSAGLTQGRPAAGRGSRAAEPGRASGRLLLGAVAPGAGGVATFVSDNQAGTGVLLLVALTLLLIGVQGTPLIRFGAESASLELDRRRRVRQVIEDISTDDSPDAVRGALEAAAAFEPSLARSYGAREADLYASQVHDPLVRAGASVEERVGPSDLVAQTDGGQPIW